MYITLCAIDWKNCLQPYAFISFGGFSIMIIDSHYIRSPYMIGFDCFTGARNSFNRFIVHIIKYYRSHTYIFNKIMNIFYETHAFLYIYIRKFVRIARKKKSYTIIIRGRRKTKSPFLVFWETWQYFVS